MLVFFFCSGYVFLIIGLVFKNILHPSRGFINITLKAIGLDFFAKNWLGDLNFALKRYLQ